MIANQVCTLLLLGTLGGAEVAASTAVKVVSDVSYLSAERTEKLDLYLPAERQPDIRSPAMVIIHGGGWSGGDKAAAREKQIGPALATAGCVCVSINYRLGALSWPVNLHDCKNAVRYLRVHADKLQVDPKRIAVMGGSAGGHLALMVAYTTDKEGLEPDQPYPGTSSRVGAVINLYGVTDVFTRVVTDEGGTPTTKPRDFADAERTFGPDRAKWKNAMPVNHVDRSIPPTLILHGRADTTVDFLQATSLARILQQHGVTHELHLIDGVGHTFDLATWRRKPLPHDLTPIVLDFLARHLRP